MRLSGSHSALNSRNACISSGPNIFGKSAARACPSPCSPLSEPPKLQHHIRRAVQELAELAQPFLAAEIEVDAHVHASLPIMPIQRTAVAVLRHQRHDACADIRQASPAERLHLPIPPTDPARPAQTPPRPAPTRAHTTRSPPLPVCRYAPRGAPGQRGHSRASASAFARASSALHAPISTSRNPTPGGSWSSSFSAIPLRRMNSTSMLIEAFQADRLVLQRQRNRIGRNKRIVESQHRQHAKRRARRQVQRRRQHRRAGSFATHQRPRHVESVLRQQLIEVVSRNPPRNARKPRSHQVRIAVANVLEPRVDLALPAAAANNAFQFLRARAPHGHARAVVEHDVEALHVVHGFSAQQPMHAATVVADHAAQGAA